MIPFKDKTVKQVFDSYSDTARPYMDALRDLILTTAQDSPHVGEIQESLKWGEPSFSCKSGSTIRINWKDSDPHHYRVFFHCQTSLVSTFRKLFSNTFKFEGNRAIALKIGHDFDLTSLKICIEASLTYHLVKKEENLSIKSSS